MNKPIPRSEQNPRLQNAKEWFYITLGSIIQTVGIYLFKVPSRFIMGGVTGISVALSAVIPEDSPFTTAWLIMILNIVLLIIGFIFLGRGFGIKTVYTSLLSSAIGVVIDYIPISLPFTDNLVLEMLFAVALPGVGTAIMFYYGASSGGTDIIAMILKKYTRLESGKALMAVDFLIMIVSFTYGMEIGLLSLIGLLIKTFIIDSMIEVMNNSKYFIIITNKGEEIGEFINTTLKRGATMWKGYGMYTRTEKDLLLVVMSPKEAAYIRNQIKAIDEHSFIIVENSSDIMGKGFRTMY